MERAIDPLLTIDAKLWADEFMATKQRLGDAEFDHVMMLGWFANAIMRGYDAGRDSMTHTPPHPDAQATIAALQARVQELEQWVQDQSTANLETMRHVDEMQSRAMEAESHLTQRTAELEAAKADRDELQSVFDLGHTRTVEADKLWQEAHGKPEVWPDLGELVGWLMRRYDDLQAELEMVKASARIWETQTTNWQTVNAERCAELERVRGALADERTAYKALSEQYNKLDTEQHRQGMEG